MLHLFTSSPFSLFILLVLSIAIVGYSINKIRRGQYQPIRDHDMDMDQRSPSTSPLKVHNLHGIAGMPMDLMTHTLSFCTANELGIVSCVHPYWQKAAQYKQLWYQLYKLQTGSDDSLSSHSDWRSAYIHRSSLWSRLRRARRSWRRILHHSVIFLIMIGAVLIYGIQLCYHQHAILSRAISTPGTITRSDLIRTASTDSEGHTTYSYVPHIEYRYRWDHITYYGDVIYVMEPYEITDTQANQLKDMFTKGSEVPVWLDPYNPRHSFLLHEPILAPYMYIIFPLCALCLLMSLSVSQVAPVHTHAANVYDDTPPQRVWVAGEAWLYEIMDTREVDTHTRMTINLITLVCVHGIGTLSLLHFMYGSHHAHDDSYWWCTVAFIILQLFASLPAYIAFTSLRLSLYVHEASVYAPHHTYFILGQSNPIIITQHVSRALHIYGMDVRIECLERYEYVDSDNQTHTALRSVYAQTITVAPAKEVSVGETIIGRGSFLLPASCHPSFRGPRFPQYLWSLTILTHAHGLPVYRKQIAIHVIPPSVTS